MAKKKKKSKKPEESGPLPKPPNTEEMGVPEETTAKPVTEGAIPVRDQDA